MSLLKKRVSGGIDLVDIIFIILLFMSWVFIANAWKNPLANTMLAISSAILAFYLIAKYTGVLKFLEITIPSWTITAIVSIPIWMISFLVLPAPGNSFAGAQVTENALEFFISSASATTFLQGWLFPITESLLAGILVAVFISFGTRKGLTEKKKKGGIIAAILLISIFMSLLHISVAASLAQAGVYSPSVLFGHQLFSFGILLIIGVFTPAGIPGMISAHVAKNLLVYAGASAGIWIGAFALFIIMDILSVVFARGKEKASYRQAASTFIK